MNASIGTRATAPHAQHVRDWSIGHSLAARRRVLLLSLILLSGFFLFRSAHIAAAANAAAMPQRRSARNEPAWSAGRAKPAIVNLLSVFW